MTMTAFPISCVPTTPSDDPSAQAAELMEKVLVPISDILRMQGLGQQGGRVWRPESIYLALLRTAVTVMGTEWAADPRGQMAMEVAWAQLIPPLKEELGASFEAARLVLTQPKH